LAAHIGVPEQKRTGMKHVAKKRRVVAPAEDLSSLHFIDIAKIVQISAILVPCRQKAATGCY
jgi:hypothetical protein